MDENKYNYIAGVTKNADWILDYSRAVTLEKNIIWDKVKWTIFQVFSDKELQDLLIQLLQVSEFQKKIRLKQLSKQKGISYNHILNKIRQYAKFKIRNREKWQIRHFHRTSMENFKTIAELGRLLSRSKLKEKKPNMIIPSWSSNNDVMMTRDKFDSNWIIVDEGFSENEVVWASGEGIMLVFNDKIMDKEDYDITWNYPTISDLSLQEYCEVILVNSQNEYEKVLKILSLNNLKINVCLKTTWKRN